MTIRWSAAGDTHVGRVRRSNEDTLRVDADRGVFLVADGMGGHAAGEVASALAADAVAEALGEAVDRQLGPPLLERALVNSFRTAHDAIVAHSLQDASTHGMGTTLTALVVRPDGEFRVGHMGDSRLYLLRGGALRQLTVDHTWVQREVDAGRITPSSARRHRLSHILTRALGAGPAEDPDLLAGHFEPGDRLLLTTDGLTGMLHDRMLEAFLEQRDRTPDALVRMLIAAANRRGGRDNVTAVVVDVAE